MGDQYPYSMNYKQKPLNAFLQAFFDSMSKVASYKMQKSMEEDAATKRQKMEQQYEVERERRKEAADASDPDKIQARRINTLKEKQLQYEVDNPKGKDAWDVYMDSLAPKPGEAAVGQADPLLAESLKRSMFAKKTGSSEAALLAVPKSEEALSLDAANQELGIVNKDIEAQTLEESKASRAKTAEIRNIMQFGLAKTPEEAEAIYKRKHAEEYAVKPASGGLTGADGLFERGYRAEHPEATDSDVYKALKRSKGEEVQSELQMRDELMKNRWYPTAFLDESTGLPLVGDREGNVRPAGVQGGARPMAKPTEADKKTASEINNIQEGITRIRSNYDPKYVGPVAGRIGSTKESTIGIPAVQAEFYGDVRSIKDALLRAKSGAQINEQEYARLVKFLPDENAPSGVFEARMNRFEREINSIIEGRNKARRGVFPKTTPNPQSPNLKAMFGVPDRQQPQSVDLDSQIDSYLGR